MTNESNDANANAIDMSYLNKPLHVFFENAAESRPATESENMPSDFISVFDLTASFPAAQNSPSDFISVLQPFTVFGAGNFFQPNSGTYFQQGSSLGEQAAVPPVTFHPSQYKEQPGGDEHSAD